MSSSGLRAISPVEVNMYLNVTSSISVKCGVPPGSILGPLLFLLYVNDIYNVSSVLFTLLFADDTNVFVQGKNIINPVRTMNEE